MKLPRAGFLALTTSIAVVTPTAVLASAFVYAQTELGYEVKPEQIVAGIFIIVLLSLLILYTWARKVFNLIDTVPKLSVDVSLMQKDISEINESVKGLLPWKEDVTRRIDIIEYRLDMKDKTK